MTTPSLRLVTAPMALTLSRVVLMPLFLVGLTRGDAVGAALAYVVLALCESSDVLDGAVARSRRQVSELGMLLDPMADTITRFGMFLGLLKIGVLPLWMAVVLFVRDMSIAYLRSLAARGGVVISARQSGKIKAVVQAFALFMASTQLLLHNQPQFAASAWLRAILLGAMLLGVVGPLLLAVALRVERRALGKLALFSAMMALPYVALQLPSPPVHVVSTAVTVSLWAATLVTAYSFIDYIRGFKG